MTPSPTTMVMPLIEATDMPIVFRIGPPTRTLLTLAMLTLFGAVDFGLNSGIVATAVSFERPISIISIWRSHLSGVWITYRNHPGVRTFAW